MDTTQTEEKNILIVEVDKDMLEMYKMFFSGLEQRYAIDIESSAGIALKKTKGKEYDLIILDIIMEPMAGDTFFTYARENINTAITPILVVSVLSPSSLTALKKINHVDFLQKPITKDQLMEKIKMMLG